MAQDIHDRLADIEQRLAALERDHDTPALPPPQQWLVEAEKNPMDKPKNRVSAKG